MALSFQFTPRSGFQVQIYQILMDFKGDLSTLERQNKLGQLAHQYYDTMIQSNDQHHTLELVQIALSIILFDNLTDKHRHDIYQNALQSAQHLNMHHIQRPFDQSRQNCFREESMVRCWCVHSFEAIMFICD